MEKTLSDPATKPDTGRTGPVARVGARVHLLAQYVWPDDSACGIYAEQVADSLSKAGVRTVLVGGVGRYRQSARPRPEANIVRLDHFCGRRGNLVMFALESRSLARAFRSYVEQYVNSGDVVVIGSFPPFTVHLEQVVHNRGATAVYWLQDYYPELLRSLHGFPMWLKRIMDRRWERNLLRWDYVVKSSANLAYHGPNARVIRNWPSVDLGKPQPFIPKTALYSGNLGYAHGIAPFFAKCEELHAEGYTITVRGDGPGIAKLPPWVNREPLLEDLDALIRSYWEAEIHLVAADPRIQTALFPSKIWNSLATGRPVVCTGFEGEMAAELAISRTAPFQQHRQQWVDFLSSLL